MYPDNCVSNVSSVYDYENIFRSLVAKSEHHNYFVSNLAHIAPGYGQKKVFCGEIKSVIMCPEGLDHATRLEPHACGRAECPICARSWAKRAADRAAATVQGFADANKYKHAPVHVALSPPPLYLAKLATSGLNEWEIMREVIKNANTLYDRLGIVAAAVIPHPYRFKTGMSKKATKAAIAARGENRYTYALSCENWDDYLEFSPHVHLICYGYLMPSDEFHKKSGGWVYANFGKREGVDIAKSFNYLFSHAWVRCNQAAVRYVRGMSTRHLGCDVKISRQIEKCPVCGASLVEVSPFSLLEPGFCPGIIEDDAKFHYETVETRRYFVRKYRKQTEMTEYAVYGKNRCM